VTKRASGARHRVSGAIEFSPGKDLSLAEGATLSKGSQFCNAFELLETEASGTPRAVSPIPINPLSA
jgi:hypothetical protein